MPFQPAPLEQDPNHIVESVHEHPQIPGEPDYDSNLEMQEFLETRIQGDRGGLRHRFGRWRAYSPVERTRIGFNRWAYLHVAKDPADRLVTDGRSWRRISAIGALASTAIFNIVGGNVASVLDDAAEEFSVLKDRIEDGFTISGHEICEEPGSTSTETIIRTKETETFVFSPNVVGESNPEQSNLDIILDRVETAQKNGTVTGIGIEQTGNTSDEWLGLGPEKDFGYGKDESENEELGRKRVSDSSKMLIERAAERGIDLGDVAISIDFNQNTLDTETLSNLQSLIESYGFSTLDEVQSIHNDSPDRLPEEVLQRFDLYFSRNRDTVIQLTVHQETRATVTTETPSDQKDCVEIDGSPEDENNDYDFPLVPFLWPALPLFMRKRIQKMKGTVIDLGDMTDPQRLLIHEDGVRASHELEENAWAYVRKYMYLFREEDRISKIYEHTYADKTGEQQALRAIFVDHEPTPESVEMIGRIFQFAGQIQGGRLGSECDAIVIYPSKNAGLHGDPKRVGLGMDVQYEGATLGVAIPSLGIVEMHMPEVPTDGERDENYNSAAWVLAHELTGHFSQLNTEPNQLDYVGHSVTGKPLYVLPNRFDSPTMAQYQKAQRETDVANGQPISWFRRNILRQHAGAPSMRWITRRGLGTLPTPDVATTYVDNIRGTDDRALREALRVKKMTGNPTRYGSAEGSDSEFVAALEADAEAAANMATGIEIPYSQAPEIAARYIRARDAELFANGYHVSGDWNKAIDRRWGSVSIGDERTVFLSEDQQRPNWAHRMDVPENFDWAQELAEWARGVEIPEPNDDVWTEIIVGQALRNQVAAEQAKRKILV